MTTLGVSASGPLAPDEVWERYARPDLWHTWAPQIRRVDVDFRVVTWSEDTRTWSWVAGFAPLVVSYLPMARLALQRLVR